MPVTVVARTARQVLREFEPDDDADMFALNADPEVMRYIGPSPFASQDETRRFLASYDAYVRYRMGRWAAVDAVDGHFLGWCGLLPLDNGDIDLGYRYRRACWGKGLATEAARVCIRMAFEELGLQSVIARAHVDNARSLRVMHKLAFAFEAHATFAGEPIVVYRLRKPESGH